MFKVHTDFPFSSESVNELLFPFPQHPELRAQMCEQNPSTAPFQVRYGEFGMKNKVKDDIMANIICSYLIVHCDFYTVPSSSSSSLVHVINPAMSQLEVNAHVSPPSPLPSLPLFHQ